MIRQLLEVGCVPVAPLLAEAPRQFLEIAPRGHANCAVQRW
jgi:hypothetical protein